MSGRLYDDTDQTELDDTHLVEFSIEDQLAQFYKAWVKVKAGVVSWQIYVGCGFRGEPRKTGGPILRGAAMSRTLQEGPNVRCGGVRGPDRVRRHSPRRVGRYPLAMLTQGS